MFSYTCCKALKVLVQCRPLFTNRKLLVVGAAYIVSSGLGDIFGNIEESHYIAYLLEIYNTILANYGITDAIILSSDLIGTSR